MRIKLTVSIKFLCIVMVMASVRSHALAQEPIKNMFQTAINISSIYKSKDRTDTLTGTAFLISNNNKIYLVTAKHLVAGLLFGQNQKQINSRIFIGTSNESQTIGLPLSNTRNISGLDKAYILSSDAEDIAIISLQKKEYKTALNTITASGYKPLKLSDFELGNSLPIGATMLHHSWFTYKQSAGQKRKMQGIFNKNTLKAVNKENSLEVTGFYRQGFNGAPLFTLNNKLTGMIINGEGYLTNADIVANPYKTGNFANAVSSARILAQLKQLQQIEAK